MEQLDPKTDGASLDIVQENIAKLKQLFPDVFSEDKIDFDSLKESLGEYIDGKEERYSFSWHGKAQAKRIAQTPSTGTLRPCKEESKNWDSTQNLFIEGDNLEVLKLLQKSYHKKIKMIYIDPPYNTGKDFVYPDNFKDNIKNYKQLTGQVDEEGKNLRSNPETSGRYHTDWLNMMYPRLKLARNLLSDCGVIFISIDDSEVSNLRKLCDEIFGEENFIADIIWEKRYGRSNDAKLMASCIDHLLLFRKSSDLINMREPRSEKSDSIYSNPDNDPRGPWTSVSFVSQRTKDERPNLSYEIQNPNTKKPFTHPTNSWKYSKEKYTQLLSENRFYWGKDGNQDHPRIKRFLSELPDGMVPVNLWKHQDTGTGDMGTKETNSLVGKDVFTYPKPISLVQRMLRMSCDSNDVILDFFSGSASTAHAVMQLNKEDGGSRKFIMVQLPELCDEKSEAFKAGYNTIAEIGKERIRQAGEKILDDNKGELEFDENKLDIGFKAFKLDTSNIVPWDGEFDSVEQDLFDAVDNIKSDRSEDDILYEILLKYGLDLTLPIEERIIEGKKVYILGLGALVICLDKEVSIETVEGIGKLKEELQPEVMRVVFKDSGFEDDVVKTNAIQILKRYDIEDVKSL